MKKSWLLLSICTLMAYAEGMERDADLIAFSQVDYDEQVAYVEDDAQEEEAVVQPPKKAMRKPLSRRIERKIAAAEEASQEEEEAVVQPPKKAVRKPAARKVERKAVAEDDDVQAEEIQQPPKKAVRKPAARKVERKTVAEDNDVQAEEIQQPPKKAPQRSRSAYKRVEAAADADDEVQQEQTPKRRSAMPKKAAKVEVAEDEVQEETPAKAPPLRVTPKQKPKQKSALNAPGEPLKPQAKPKMNPRNKSLQMQKQLQVQAEEEDEMAPEEAAPEQPVQKSKFHKPRTAPNNVSQATPAQVPKKQPKVSYIGKRNLAQNDDSDMSSGMNNNNGNYNNQAVPPQKPTQNTWDGHRKPIFGEEGWAGMEFLWWKADETGLDFAIDKEFPVFQNPAYAADAPLDGLAGSMRHASFRWEPGFRAQIGYRFARDAWEAFAEYTWFMTNDVKRHIGFPGGGAQPMLVGTLPQSLNGTVTSADSNLTLKTQVANIDLGRRFELSRYVLFRFFAGVRGAWMRQNWRVNYFANSNGASAFNNLKWSYEGYGLHFGLNSDWYLGWGFNFFAQGSVSGLYGRHRDSVYTSSSLSSHPLQNASLVDHRTVEETQMLAGLAWGDTWGQFGLKIYAGWEMNTWYNLAEHYRTNTANVVDETINIEKIRNLTTSNLSMKGLTLGLVAEF